MTSDHDSFPNDLDDIDSRLRAARPVPSTDERERIHTRATATADTRTRRLNAPRLAMVSLVSGALLLGGGSAALAVSGLGADDSAGIAQYVQPNSTDVTPLGPSSTNETVPDQTSTTDDPVTTDEPDTNDVVPDRTSDTTDPTQAVRQVSVGGSDNRLPFTGLVTLPLILLGVCLLATGFALRRRTGSLPSGA